MIPTATRFGSAVPEFMQADRDFGFRVQRRRDDVTAVRYSVGASALRHVLAGAPFDSDRKFFESCMDVRAIGIEAHPWRLPSGLRRRIADA